MVEREKISSTSSDLESLRTMKGLKDALEKEVKEKFGVIDIGRFEKASFEDQKEIVEGAFETAKEKYSKLGYQEKLAQLRKIEKNFGSQNLDISQLLQGLGLRPKVEIGRDNGPLGRIKRLFSKS